MAAIDNSPQVWRHLFPRLDPLGHKYDRGCLVIVAAKLPGASQLAAYAARRMGAGVVKLLIRDSDKALYGGISPGTVLLVYKNFYQLQDYLSDDKATAYLYGPGVTSRNAETQEVIFKILTTGKPCVLDAGALTAFSDNRDALLENLHEKCVVTPHEGEFRKVFSWWKTPEESVSRLCEKRGMTCILKMPQTVIGQENRLLINRSAPATLATAGTGDVLAGYVSALLAQGMPPLEASAAAVYLHARCAESFGPGLIAEDLAEQLPAVLKAEKLV